MTATAEPSSVEWYLVHTKPLQEKLARLNLERQGFACYLPLLQLEKLRRQKLTSCIEPLFPRYLFVQLDTSSNGKSWWPIRSTIGVSNMVHFGTQLAKVDQHLIRLLQERERIQSTQRMFAPGDKVVITEGPFAGIEAVYQTTCGERRSIILLEILSKSVPMQISPTHLRKAGIELPSLQGSTGISLH